MWRTDIDQHCEIVDANDQTVYNCLVPYYDKPTYRTDDWYIPIDALGTVGIPSVTAFGTVGIPSVTAFGTVGIPSVTAFGTVGIPSVTAFGTVGRPNKPEPTPTPWG
jgi:hypothetical protein